MATRKDAPALGSSIEGAVSRIQREGRIVFERVEQEIERRLTDAETAVRSRLDIPRNATLAEVRQECHALALRIAAVEERLAELSEHLADRERVAGD